jgi:hypothetical protein
MLYFSRSTVGFYTSEIHGEAIPSDAVEISQSLYDMLIAGQSAGMIIAADDRGFPILIDAPAPTEAEQASVVVQRRDTLLQLAATRIAPLQDAVDLDDASATEVAALKAWKQYRIQLNRIEPQPGYPTTIEWPVSPAEESA